MAGVTDEVSKQYEDAVELAVSSFWKEHGYPPTIRDLCKWTRIKSTCTIYHVLGRLEQQQRVELRGPHGRPFPWDYR